jgi:hypothetical protein
MLRILEIARRQHRPAASFSTSFLTSFLFGLVEKRDENVGALARISDRDGAAGTAVAAGNDRP